MKDWFRSFKQWIWAHRLVFGHNLDVLRQVHIQRACQLEGEKQQLREATSRRISRLTQKYNDLHDQHEALKRTLRTKVKKVRR